MLESLMNSLEYSVHWMAFSVAFIATGLVALSLWIERQNSVAQLVNVEDHYIADDEVSWTDLMKTLEDTAR